MFRSFVKRGVLLVFITAIVLGIAYGLFFSHNYIALVPAGNHSRIAYHEDLSPAAAMPEDIEGITEGCLIGTLKGAEELPVRYHAGYIALSDAASLEQGSIGGTGSAYLRIINVNAAKLGDTVTYSGVYGNYRYALQEEAEYQGEAQLLAAEKGGSADLVIYFQRRGEAGLSATYKALYYEEVD